MQRRKFLGAAAALAALSDSPSEEAEEASDDTERERPSQSSKWSLEDVYSHALIERYDEGGQFTVNTNAPREDPFVAAVIIEGAWGEAGVGLTAPEARAVGLELLEASTTKENQ